MRRPRIRVLVLFSTVVTLACIILYGNFTVQNATLPKRYSNYHRRSSYVRPSAFRPSAQRIPNVVHYIIDYRHHVVDFQFYLSIMSVINFLNPAKIVCHCLVLPIDTTWWIAAKRYAKHKLELRLIQNSPLVNFSTLNFKGVFERNYFRMKLLLDEGGIFFEPDIIAVKSFKSLRNYSALLIKPSSSTYSDQLVMSVPNATFSKQWIAMYSNSYSAQANMLTERQINAMEYTRTSNKFMYIKELDLFATYSFYKWERSYITTAGVSATGLNKCLSTNSRHRKLVEFVLYNSETYNIRVANIYHYAWQASQSRDLSFIEHQSIKSLFFMCSPATIYFHSTVSPAGEKWNDVMSLKNFVSVHHPNTVMKDFKSEIYRRIWEKGGILLQFGVLFINACDSIRGTKILQSTNMGTVTDSVLMVPAKVPLLRHMLDASNTVEQSHIQHSSDSALEEEECIITFENIQEATRTTACGEWRTSVWVRMQDINNILTNKTVVLSMNNSVGEILRYVLYGVSSPFKRSLYKIPNIVHYIWFGLNKPLKFFHFLSMISAYLIQKPDNIYIHYESLPSGFWWEKLRRFVSNLVLVHTTPNSTLGGKNVKWIQHKADYTRIQVLRKYGGIYVDTDVYFINSLDPLRVYDYVMSQAIPKILSNGFILSTKDWKFLKRYEEGYNVYRNESWNYNSLYYPYLLWIKDRDAVQLVPTRRTLVPSWRDLGDLYDSGRRFYWKDNYIVHLYGRHRLPENTPLEEAIYSPGFYNTTFGEVSRYIYEMYLQQQSKS